MSTEATEQDIAIDLRQTLASTLDEKGFEATTTILVNDVLELNTTVKTQTEGSVVRLSFQSRAFSLEIKQFLDQTPHTYRVQHLLNGSAYPCPVVAYEGTSALDALYEGLLDAHINGLFW